MIRTLALCTLQAVSPPAPAAQTAPAGVTSGAPPARELLRELCGQPRLAGTIGSRVGAQIVARHLTAAGWQVEFDEREVLLSYPRTLEFAIHADGGQTALVERHERFEHAAVPPGDVPKYNAWSASGSVRGRVVDAGYGTRADFERLKALGLELSGTVALVRYGRAYRGIKVDLATEFGCAAVLLYSDPASDGAQKGATWPEGPWKPEHEAQRGSILAIQHTPGDPSTPGWASPAPGASGVRRLSGDELAAALPRIPCLPIGAGDARILLERLAPVGAERLGPGPVEARLALDVPRVLVTIVNVIARLPGDSPRTVIAGAHRDAWVRGANDDGAGTVALLRAAQHLGERARAGWKPANTLTIALWDAEEFGLVGSTEWAESRADWLRAYGLAYLNADVGVSGPRFSGASGSPGLLGALRRVLERVPAAARADGGAPANLWEEWRAQRGARAPNSAANAGDARASEPELGLPGSGSDFAVFAHHLSLPVLEFSFGGGQGGQYHTAFDEFEFVERHIDPGFVGHELCGRVFAELLGDLADAGPLVHDPSEAALTLGRRALADARAIARTDAALGHALQQLGQTLVGLGEEYAAPAPRRGNLELHDAGPQWRRLPELRFYRALEQREGLPGRSWFRNALWAPGLEDGYGAETFPTLRAAAQRGPAQLEEALNALLTRIAQARPEAFAAGGR